MSNKKSLMILGTRGVPAAHGGFETFAERLALYLSEKKWEVIVYCQQDDSDKTDPWEDDWKGVHRVHIPVSQGGSLGTIVFDWKSTLHAARRHDLKLTLGYNTAVFCARYRVAKQLNLINMDGIEWRRQKWGLVAKTWFWLNEWAGCRLGNHLVADHPEIKRHLEGRTQGSRITTIPYGADRIEAADETILADYGLQSTRYAILIARAEPENSVLEVVKAWSRRPRDGWKLVILGKYDPAHAYQDEVMKAGADDVLFLGAIYEPDVVQALRFFARLYVHGHQVGGTNPSLVEALGAGNPVLAHDNRFNRWVAGPGASYFDGEDGCDAALTELLADDDRLGAMREASLARHQQAFTWEKVLGDYESLLEDWNQRV